MEAYIRVGNESVIAPDYIVNELILIMFPLVWLIKMDF